MKNLPLLALAGLALSFAMPAFAQQKDTPDPQKRAALVAFEKNEMDAWDSNDAHALAATFTEDAVLVTNTGPIYGREDIEKYYTHLFQKMNFSNYLITPDQYSPHVTGTAGHEDWANGEWSLTVKGQNWGPKEVKGFWSAVHVLEGDVWKNRMVIGNTSSAPAAAPSPTATPSNK
jgi:ketosteroid isomerase-like protein